MKTLVLLGALLASVPTFMENISFSHEAAPASKVFKSLSQQLGTELKIGDPISRETLLVAVHDLPRQQLLDKIAKLLHASWIEKAGAKILQRSEEEQRNLRQNEQSSRAEAFQQQISAKTDTIVQRRFDAQAAEQIATLRSKTARSIVEPPSRTMVRELLPIQRLTARLLRMFDGKHLAAIPIHRSEFYSTVPEGKYKQFPPGADEYVKAFLSEQTLLEEVATREGVPFREDARPTKEINFEIRAIDYNVVQITTFYAAAKTGQLGVLVLSFNEPPDSVLALKAVKLKPPSYTSPTQELFRGITSGDRVVPSSQLKGWMEHPEEHDPLAGFCGEALQSAAEQLHAQLLAVLPDNYVQLPLIAFESPKFDYRVFWAKTAMWCRTKLDGAWLTLEPCFPCAALDTKEDRYELGAYFISYFQNRKNTLEAEGKYIHAMPDPLVGGLESPYVDLLGRTDEGFEEFWEHGSKQFMWLYGSLTPDQKRLLYSKGLPVAELSAQQRDYLAEGSSYIAGRDIKAFDKWGGTFEEGTSLRGAVESDIHAVALTGSEVDKTFTATDIAAQLLFKKLNLYPDQRDIFSKHTWQLSRGTSYRFAVEDQSGDTICCPLAFEDSGYEGGEVAAIEQLPSDFLAIVNSEYERLSHMPPAEVYRLVTGK